MTKKEFEALQPHEFLDRIEGYKWRKEDTENMLAYFTAASMSVHTTKPISPRELLEPLRKVQKPVDKEEEKRNLKKAFKGILRK